MTHIPFKKRLNVVVAIGDEHVSTATAYAKLDEMYNDFKDERESALPRLDRITNGLIEGDIRMIADNMYNIFEQAILPMCPQAREIKNKMLEAGALGAMMSGSGPAVFGIFESKESAERAVKTLGENAYAVTTV